MAETINDKCTLYAQWNIKRKEKPMKISAMINDFDLPHAFLPCIPGPFWRPGGRWEAHHTTSHHTTRRRSYVAGSACLPVSGSFCRPDLSGRSYTGPSQVGLNGFSPRTGAWRCTMHRVLWITCLVLDLLHLPAGYACFSHFSPSTSFISWIPPAHGCSSHHSGLECLGSPFHHHDSPVPGGAFPDHWEWEADATTFSACLPGTLRPYTSAALRPCVEYLLPWVIPWVHSTLLFLQSLGPHPTVDGKMPQGHRWSHDHRWCRPPGGGLITTPPHPTSHSGVRSRHCIQLRLDYHALDSAPGFTLPGSGLGGSVLYRILPGSHTLGWISSEIPVHSFDFICWPTTIVVIRSVVDYSVVISFDCVDDVVWLHCPIVRWCCCCWASVSPWPGDILNIDLMIHSVPMTGWPDPTIRSFIVDPIVVLDIWLSDSVIGWGNRSLFTFMTVWCHCSVRQLIVLHLFCASSLFISPFSGKIHRFVRHLFTSLQVGLEGLPSRHVSHHSPLYSGIIPGCLPPATQGGA